MQHVFDSPLGALLITYDRESIQGLHFDRAAAESGGPSPVLDRCLEQLAEYFAGMRRDFDLPLAVRGTDFQKTVWDALKTIAYGEVVSYGHIAAQIGKPKAPRAVGGANNKNPISIIVPCHRVVGAGGKMVGYGGGLWRKEWLLDHEKKHVFTIKY